MTTTATTSTPAGVRKEVTKTPVQFDSLYKNEFQKPGTMTAQIKQVVTTKSFYPSKRTASNLQENIFDTKEFGFEEQEFVATETRVAWLLVPENTTEADIKARVDAAAAKGACIYRVLDNAPILDDNQKFAITSGQRTLDQFAATQVVRFPENEKTIADGTANKITPDTRGLVQYRRTFFWKTPQEDVDMRGKNTPYVSAELQAELAGASLMQGQTV